MTQLPEKDFLIELRFPGLKNDDYQITSPKTPTYNCIAWAAGDDSRPWWPVSYPNTPPYYWPEQADDEQVEDFIRGFEAIGYELCENGELEERYEKVAIYLKDGEVEHMARQQPSGKWTSKCGGLYDLEHHELDAVGGDTELGYGSAEYFMKRKRAPE